MRDIKKYTVQLVRESETAYSGEQINTVYKAVNLINKVFSMDCQPSEIFVMLALDTKKRPVGCFLVHQGAISHTVVSPRDVFQRALLVNAHSIIIAHNHPSGDPMPSTNDNEVTDTMRKTGDLLGVKVVDSLIIGDNGRYFSYAEEGR